MKAWLRCQVRRGMFSHEFAVTYPAESKIWEWQKSVFVPASYVRVLGEEQGEVLVTVVGSGASRYAVLPSPEQDVVKPAEADLSLQ
jgi:hypothetical protein